MTHFTLALAALLLAPAVSHAADRPLAAPAPLVVDPIYGNAGDPTAVCNHASPSDDGRSFCGFASWNNVTRSRRDRRDSAGTTPSRPLPF